MSKEYSNKRPLILSLLVHVILIACLIFAFVPKNYRLPGPVNPHSVIQVRAVSQKLINQQQLARQKNEQAKKRRVARQRRLQQLRQQRLQRERRERTVKRRRAIALAKKKKLLKYKKQLREKNRRLKKSQEKKQLLAQSQLLSKQLMNNRLRKESKQVSALQAKQQKGIINRYIPQILTAIQQRWLFPPGTNPHLFCIYQINLAPGGVGVGVKLLTSSGSVALDRGAKQAIWGASPLPVPDNPALFDKLRRITLTMRPENAVLK